jgi:hypothetical protein
MPRGAGGLLERVVAVLFGLAVGGFVEGRVQVGVRMWLIGLWYDVLKMMGYDIYVVGIEGMVYVTIIVLEANCD